MLVDLENCDKGNMMVMLRLTDRNSIHSDGNAPCGSIKISVKGQPVCWDKPHLFVLNHCQIDRVAAMYYNTRFQRVQDAR